MPTAVITLTVTSFVANGCCAIATPVITNSGGNRVYLNGQKICIKSKGKSSLSIQFLVVGNGGPYTVNNIAFSGVLTDPNGAATFTNPTPSGNGITVNDTFAAQPNWSYTIGITNGAGQTGTIDPGIENTDEN
jgi:hypothetical protein